MADNRVTETNDPVLWRKLMGLWAADRRPGWIMSGKQHYKVFRLTDTKIEFAPMSRQELYDSTSF